MLGGDGVVGGGHLKKNAAVFEDGRAGMFSEELFERTSQFQGRDLRLRAGFQRGRLPAHALG